MSGNGNNRSAGKSNQFGLKMRTPTSSTTAPTKSQVWNVPNVLSAIRLLLSIGVFALIPLHCYWWALLLFVIAAGTDWIDGWWARRFDQITQLGRILDPFCDKILICGTFILLAVEMRGHVQPWFVTITGWMAVIVVGREMLVTALRGFIEQSGGDFSAKFAGKLKMLFQCIAAGASLVALAMLNDKPQVELPVWLVWTMAISIWLAVLSTIQSGFGYIQVAAKSLR
jgi:CDP-diacylglycerol--glycerol-3-phosphate 3-phosphatidyltransferase